MGMVWSCYKYLSQASEAATRRRRSFDSEDAAQAPEDAQVCTSYRAATYQKKHAEIVSILVSRSTCNKIFYYISYVLET